MMLRRHLDILTALFILSAIFIVSVNHLFSESRDNAAGSGLKRRETGNIRVKNEGKPKSKKLKTQSKPVFAIAIFSREKSVDKREAIRRTWLSQISTTPFDIKYKFILDIPTKATQKEQQIHKDIIYTNMNALPGQAFCFSSRMLFWFRHVTAVFPTAKLVAKMDDDTYPCIPKLFERIFKVMTPKLYYGWRHGGNSQSITKLTRIDEMFVVVGRELVDRILKRKYCGCPANFSLADSCNKRNSQHKLESNYYADMALASWLSSYKDVNRVSDNRYIQHFSYEFEDRMKNYKFAVPEFCLTKFIFHKSSTNIMYKLHHYNMFFRAGNKNVPMEKIPLKVLRPIPMTMRSIVQRKTDLGKEKVCKYWVVLRADKKPFKRDIVTTINYFTALKWCVVIVSDQHSPPEKNIPKSLGKNDKIIVLAPQKHEVYFQTLSDALFWDHVGRRNIGYAYAILHGATMIFDYYHNNRIVPCVKKILPSLKDYKGKGYLSLKCGGAIWPCSTFNLMALPITVNPEVANWYRYTIANFVQNIKPYYTDSKNGVSKIKDVKVLKDVILEIPPKQRNFENVYLHLYRRGLLEYDDVVVSKLWITYTKTNTTC